MRRIDIFVSSRKDMRKERAVAERVIRSVAAEFGLPVSASYSNWLRTPRRGDEVAAERTNRCLREGALLLCPRFWECQDRDPEGAYREHLPNTGRFDLVICLLWSRLGTKMAPTFIMPDGSEPKSATHYEIAWALDQRKHTPGFPALQIYRNRSTPAAPFEPRQELEALSEQWYSVQEFFADCERNTAFAEACSEYWDLGEFEALFRKRFRGDIAARMRDEHLPEGVAPKAYCWDANPFRGLDFFDFEHARLFHGRTKTVGEVLDVLQQQAAAKKPFVLVLGPGGSGKTSLVRAGVLPVLTQVGTTEGEGPWRFARTRPGGGGAGDPFDALAAALLEEAALPEFPDAVTHNGWQNLAAQLRDHPESAALRLREMLDHLTVQALNPYLEHQRLASPLVDKEKGVELAHQNKLGRVKPKVQLALVVDQLEELFVGGFSAELQQKYIAALSALVRCQRVFVIATLRSDFYASFQKSCSPEELAVLSGRFELRSPTIQEIDDMIRLPAEATGLRFERDPETGRKLDASLLEAIMVSDARLPLLEHLLSELYRMQLPRNDGVLRWSDYRELGELESALADRAESAFLALDGDAQVALESVIRKLTSRGNGEEGVLIRRPVPYRDLVSASQLSKRQKAGAKRLISRFVQEGLFHTETDPNKEMLVSVPQESLLQNWPRVRRLLNAYLEFLRMRDRLEANVKLWQSRGRRSDHLLRSGSGFSEAEALLGGFRTSLSDTQLDYLDKSLKTHDRRHLLRSSAVLAGIAGVTVFASLAGLQWRNAKKERVKAETADANFKLAESQRHALQTRLKETEVKAQQVQKNAELAASQRDALQSQLENSEAKVELAQKNAELATSQRDAVLTQLKETEAKAEQAQKNADLATSERDALQSQLKTAEEQAERSASAQPLGSPEQRDH